MIKRRVQHAFHRTSVGGEWLERIATAWGLKVRGEARAISVSVRNENWKIVTSQGRAILKRYRPSVDSEQITFEHAVLRHLAALNFPSPRLITAANGDTCIEMEGRHYALFHYLPGYTQFDEHVCLPNQKLPFLKSEARLLARLHDSLADLSPPGRNPQGFKDLETMSRWWDKEFFTSRLQTSIQVTEPTLRHNDQPALRRMMAMSDSIIARIDALERSITDTQPEIGVIHGDYGQYNLLIRRGCPLIVADFELARLDYRVIDVIAMLSSEVKAQSESYDENHFKMKLMVDQYRTTRSRQPANLSALPDVWEWLTLRRLIVLWESYASSNDNSWLHHIHKRLARLDWIERERPFLEELTL